MKSPNSTRRSFAFAFMQFYVHESMRQKECDGKPLHSRFTGGIVFNWCFKSGKRSGFGRIGESEFRGVLQNPERVVYSRPGLLALSLLPKNCGKKSARRYTGDAMRLLQIKQV